METVATPSLQSLPINQITPSPHQARKEFDESALNGLAESMKQEGLLQPVTVRKVGDAYELIAGERRLRAAKLLGWTTLDAVIIQTVSEGEAAAKGLVENLQREDLNPIEEGEGFAELNQLDPAYWTQDKISKIAGRSRVYITQSLGLLKLPDIIKDYVRRLTLNRSQTLEIMRLTSPNDQIEAASKAQDLSWKETRQLVDRLLKGNQKKGTSKEQTNQEGFQFTHKGPGVAIRAYYPGIGSIDDFLLALRTAFVVWNAKEQVPPSQRSKIPGLSSAKGPYNPADNSNKLQLPETPEGIAELEALGKDGPGPIYAKLLGPDNAVAKATQNDTWKDYHAQDVKEGLPKLLEALKAGNNTKRLDSVGG